MFVDSVQVELSALLHPLGQDPPQRDIISILCSFVMWLVPIHKFSLKYLVRFTLFDSFIPQLVKALPNETFVAQRQKCYRNILWWRDLLEKR